MPIEARAEQHHRLQYSNNVTMVAQQLRPQVREAVTEVQASGEAMSAADLVGAVDAIETEGYDRRNIENPPKNTRRWLVHPKPLKSGQYIDDEEKMKRAMDPTSVYVESHTRAVQRAVADKILGVTLHSDGTFGTRNGGVLGAAAEGQSPGGSTTPLPAANYVAHNSTGLTLAKLKEAKEKLNQRFFGLEDGEAMYMAITPKQVTDLLNLADGDGNSLNAFAQQQLQNGAPTPLVGFRWIVTPRLPKDSNGNRLCPVWTRSNIALGIWEDVNGQMWNDTHADNKPYVRVRAFVDAVRLEDAGVEVVECVES